jgi:hypothetical protein
MQEILPEKGHLAKLGGAGPPCPPPGSYAPASFASISQKAYEIYKILQK